MEPINLLSASSAISEVLSVASLLAECGVKPEKTKVMTDLASEMYKKEVIEKLTLKDLE